MNINDLKPGSYKVVSSVNKPKEQPVDNRDFLQKAGDFAKNLPGGKIGEAVGTALVTGKEYATGHPDIAQNIANTGPSVPQQIGAYAETAGLFAGGGFGAAEKGASFGAKALNLGKNTAIGAGIGYGADVASGLENKESNPLAPGVGTAIGAALPGAGAVASIPKAILGRLFKGLGSGLSGVSAQTIEDIVNNPKTALKASEILAKNGSHKVVENNARTIVNGISKIRQEARSAFGKGLGELKAEDINPQTFRANLQPTLDAIGSKVGSTGVRTLSNVEFSEPKNLKTASRLINKLSTVELNGLSLRRLVDEIESSKYKIATSDERLSFNAFVNDLSKSVKDAINGSTNKLQDINAAYSGDMQLSEAAQKIFGTVNFKNLPEVLRASQKLEGLFTQKGMAPQITDDFLKRIGVNAADFRTGEAVRQIGNKEPQANSTGLSIGEVVRGATSAVVTPETVKNLSIYTGLAAEKIGPLLKALKPAARNVLIEASAQAGSEPPKQGQESGATQI